MKEFKDGKLTVTCNQCLKKETNPEIIRTWVSLIGLDVIVSQGTEIKLPMYPDISLPDFDFCCKKCISDFFTKYFWVEYFTLFGKPTETGKHYQLISNNTIIKEFDSDNIIENVLEKYCEGYSIAMIMHGKIFNQEDSIDIGVMLYKEK